MVFTPTVFVNVPPGQTPTGGTPKINATELNKLGAAVDDVDQRVTVIETTGVPDAGMINVRQHGAVGDGVTDDGPALRTLFAAGGDIVMPAGTYLFRTTGTTCVVPAGTRIRGVPGKTVINLDTTAVAAREFLRNGGDNVFIDGVTIVRVSDFPCVVFPVQAYTGLTLRNVTVNGNRTLYPTNYCHALQLGVQSGTTTRVRVYDSFITECSYGLFQTNASTGATRDIIIQNSRFHRNTGDDLEFNSPAGQTVGVRVENNVFTDNQKTTAGAGFAVGFAKVNDGVIRGNTITNYLNEGIHIEDYCTDTLIAGNAMSACGLNQGAYIRVIGSCTRVRIVDNAIDATANTNGINVIESLAGGTGNTVSGGPTLPPSTVTLTGNVVLAGAGTNAIYCENTARGVIANNELIGSGAVNSGVYGGTTHTAMNIYAGGNISVTGNVVRGFLTGLFPIPGSVSVLGNGSVLSGNVFADCQLGAGLTNLLGAVVQGNMFVNCQYPVIVGRGAVATKSSVITGNHALGCANPMAIGGTNPITAAGTASVGTGVTLAVAALPTVLPTGAVVIFAGGGTLTLTATASFQATSLVGNLVGAAVANSETGMAYTAFSTDATQDRHIADNGDTFYGAAGLGVRTVSVAANYRVLGDDEIVIATASGITVTLPPAAQQSGPYTIKNSSAGSITLAAVSGAIDGSATRTITTTTAAEVVSNGTNWIVL